MKGFWRFWIMKLSNFKTWFWTCDSWHISSLKLNDTSAPTCKESQCTHVDASSVSDVVEYKTHTDPCHLWPHSVSPTPAQSSVTAFTSLYKLGLDWTKISFPWAPDGAKNNFCHINIMQFTFCIFFRRFLILTFTDFRMCTVYSLLQSKV